MPTYTATHYTHTYWFAHTYTPGTHNNTNTCYMNQPRMKMWVLTETLRFEVFHGKTHRSRIITVRRSSTDVYHPEEKCMPLTPCTPWLVWRLIIRRVYPPWFWVTPAPLDGQEWEPYSSMNILVASTSRTRVAKVIRRHRRLHTRKLCILLHNESRKQWENYMKTVLPVSYTHLTLPTILLV